MEKERSLRRQGTVFIQNLVVMEGPSQDFALLQRRSSSFDGASRIEEGLARAEGGTSVFWVRRSEFLI